MFKALSKVLELNQNGYIHFIPLYFTVVELSEPANALDIHVIMTFSQDDVRKTSSPKNQIGREYSQQMNSFATKHKLLLG